MGRFSGTIVTSPGSYGLVTNVEARPGQSPSLQIAGSSFNLVVRATNFFDSGTNVGSNWTDVSSQLTVPGLLNFPSQSYGAVIIQVNSVVGPLALAIG